MLLFDAGSRRYVCGIHAYMLHAIILLFFFVFFFHRLQAHQSSATSDPRVSSALGVVLTAMFIACAAYVAAGVSAILDLRFIAINKRRNFIITTVVRKAYCVVLCSLLISWYAIRNALLGRGTGTLGSYD